MRCKKTLAAALALTLALLCQPAPAEGTGRADVLVIYPEEADQRGVGDCLSAVAETLFSLRCSADFAEAEKAGAVIGGYERVIWCATSPSARMDPGILAGYEGQLLMLGAADGLSAFGVEADEAFSGSLIAEGVCAFTDEVPFHHSTPLLNAGRLVNAAYRNGSLSVAGGELPMAGGSGRRHYVALCEYTDAFSRAVLMREIAQWLWPYESRMHTYTTHVVLSPVYPFEDPLRLQRLVDFMVERKMVFAISVMPIYEHSDYPAMGQFCEVLRYAQANGGAVILHAPIIQGSVDPAALAQRLTDAAQAYLDQGVYPLALEIPSAWLFQDDLLPILGRYSTLFFSELDAFAAEPVRNYGLRDFLNLGSQQIVPALKIDDTGVSRLACCATAVYLSPGTETDERMMAVIEAAKGTPIPMQSLWNMAHSVYMNDGHYMTWDRNTLLVDGAQRSRAFIPAAPQERFNYRRTEYYRFVANLNNQNYFLIGVSMAVLVLFLFLAQRSRRQMHRRFLTKAPQETGENQDVGG